MGVGRSPSYLVVHRNAYYFRIRIPDDLRPVLVKREYRLSLRSARDLHRARLWAMSLGFFVSLTHLRYRLEVGISGYAGLWASSAEVRFPSDEWGPKRL